jgi:hypothetical protein
VDDAVRIWSNPGFERERSDLRALEPREATAITHAITKLRVEGTRLGFPWTSAVRQSPLPGLRELRPRGGRSRHRVLYQQVSGGFELLAIAREAQSNRRAFNAAIQRAATRAVDANGRLTT